MTATEVAILQTEREMNMPLPRSAELFYGLGEKLTNEQKVYLDSIFDNQVTIVNAPAGSGKTTLAVGAAKIMGRKLYYIFAPVEEGKMGFRPGTQDEKEAAYYQPLKDALLEINEFPEKVIWSEEVGESKKRNDDVWVYPMSHIFARGTNIKDATVIIAEAQNFTRDELKKVLTRIHDSCTVIIEGHTGQCDLKYPQDSGFEPYINHLSQFEWVQTCKLSVNFRGRLSQAADAFRW